MQCPRLECDKAISSSYMGAGKCYTMLTDSANQSIYANECFD